MTMTIIPGLIAKKKANKEIKKTKQIPDPIHGITRMYNFLSHQESIKPNKIQGVG